MLSYLSSYIWTSEETEAENSSEIETPKETGTEQESNSIKPGCSTETTWVLVNDDGAADVMEHEVGIDGEPSEPSTSTSRTSSIRESSYHPMDQTDSSESMLLRSNFSEPQFETKYSQTNCWDMGPPSCFHLNEATASLANLDAEKILEASYVENCLLELSVSRTEDVRDYLENSQADVRTLVSHRKKPKKYQVRPSSLQAALQIQEDPKFEAAKKDQQAKLKAKKEHKANSKNALKRQNLQRHKNVATKNKSFGLMKSRMINQCASRSTCH